MMPLAPMVPPRRAFRLLRDTDHAAIVARLPPDERYLTGVLIRPAGGDSFGWLAPGQGAHAGDDLLLYAIDTTDVAQLNDVNKEFDRYYYPPQSGLSPDEEELTRTRFPPRHARVLEVCCGAGRITSHLVRAGNRVVGLDFNRHCLAAGRRRDGAAVDYVLGDATDLPFADRAFDVVCCLENSFGALFSGAAATLAEMMRVTRTGGRVIVGLREQSGRPDRFHLYHTPNGLVSVVRTFDAPSVGALLESLPSEAASRVVRRERIEGAARPWGGRTFYVELLLS